MVRFHVTWNVHITWPAEQLWSFQWLLYGVSYLSLTSPMRQQHCLLKWLHNWHQQGIMRLVFPVCEWCQGKLHNVWDGYVLVADNSTFPVWVAGWNVPWDGYLRVLCADRLQVPACISKSLLSAQCWWWRGNGCCVSDLSSITQSSKAFMILCKAVLGYWLICKAVIFSHGMGLSHHYVETLVLYPSHLLFVQWLSLLGEWCQCVKLTAYIVLLPWLRSCRAAASCHMYGNIYMFLIY